ncbi:CapA family protein [Streptomyces bambusae]|uniref:CapA family protein n=1 Tax=Streptomyces bambusae TaxID=1550616 RepID=UPI001CFD0FC4|nr:CapA family protein [Streptomyces bambusae]MCB5164320.1 CapA family protein [Streptomyces bambusae]
MEHNGHGDEREPAEARGSRVRRPAAVAAVAALAVGAAGVWLVPKLADSGADADGRLRAGAGAARESGAAAAPGRPFTLVATGDIIPYPSIIARAADDAGAGGQSHDFRKILAGVKPLVSAADLALCHHEIPYGQPGGPYTGYPTFKAPHQLAASLKDTGYEGCSTASNHTLDAGYEGLVRTLDHLDKAGLKHVGSARSPKEAATPAWYTAGGAKVAQLSYTYGTNGIPLPDGKPWSVNLIDRQRILDDARAARRAGAQVVLVSVHWGTEWQTAPDEQQRTLAKELTAARTGGMPDIDLIIGTHNHVPQPYEKVNGVWVVYGMGDQVASFVPADKKRGNMSSVPRFTFAPWPGHPGRWQVVKAEYFTQYSDMGPPFRVACVSCGPAPEGRREEYAAVDRQVTEAVLSRGAAAQGLVRATR